MAVWCVVNPKGGTGKSVVAANLAAAAARQGRRTLLMDLSPDPVLHLMFSAICGENPGAAPRPALASEVPLFCCAQPTLLPYAPDALLDQITAADGAFDLVVLDAPSGGLAQACLPLLGADVGLFVCRPGALDVLGAVRAWKAAQRISGPRPRVDRAVVCRVPPATEDTDVRAILQQHCDGQVAQTVVAERAAIERAVQAQHPAAFDDEAGRDFLALYAEIDGWRADG